MDAICAAKILQYLLRFDNIVYVLVPIKTITELKKAYEDQKVEVIYWLIVCVCIIYPKYIPIIE